MNGNTKTIIPTPTGELRVEDKTLSHRIPVNGTITMELDYKLTGGRLSTSTVVMGDGRGSVLATAPLLQTTSPSTTAAQEFDAWGKPISIASKVPRHGYVGFEADAAFGTYTFGRRVYDPTLRRWLSADPLLSANPEVDGEAAQLDIWGYAGANPAARTDPTGEVAPALVVAMVVGIMIAFESDTDPVSYTDADTGTTTTYGGADISVPIRRAMQVAGGPLAFAASLYGAYESNTNPSATSAPPPPKELPAGGPHTATDDGIILPAGEDIDAVPTAEPDPRNPQWAQVHNSHEHEGDPRAHAHGPEAGTGKRTNAPLAETMKRVDKGLKDGTLRLRTDRGDKGGEAKK